MEKGGEIIPKIVGVDLEQRHPFSTPFRFIENCPACGTPLVKREDEAAHYCPNSASCPPQIKGKLEHFISRRAMDINAAEATIDQLFRKGLVTNVADLYDLTYDQLLGLERFGEKSARNLVDSIAASRKVPYPRVLYALGIRHVGETVARKLAVSFGSMEALTKAGKEELEEVDEIGSRISSSLMEYFSDPSNQSLLGRLEKEGLQFRMEESNEERSDNLAGMTFVITGVFRIHSRDRIKELIMANGGKNTASISKNTNYVLAGENMGPGKLEKASKLGIPIISEEEFLEML